MNQNLLKELMQQLDETTHRLAGKTATIGFDGFIDKIVRIVKIKEDEDAVVYFQQIKEFGQFLMEKDGQSSSFEWHEMITKIGGNMPILANALGTLGVQVNSIGMMGHPKIDVAFEKMSANCNLYSFADPCHTLAIEFNDGKIMMANMDIVNQLRWNWIKQTVGLSELIRLFDESDCLGIVNWSEIHYSNEIWEGILREVLPSCSRKKRMVMFDLSDCTKRSTEDILQMLRLIDEFAKHCQVVLCLNENETLQLNRAIGMDNERKELVAIGDALYQYLNIDTLIIRNAKKAIAWNRQGRHKMDTFYVEEPILTTGGGDNFNAGFCFAQLLGLDIMPSLLMGVAVAGFYVTTGHSPSVAELCGFLTEKHAVA